MPERDFTQELKEYLLDQTKKSGDIFTYSTKILSSDIANEIAGLTNQTAQSAANFATNVRYSRQTGQDIINTIWDTVYTLDSRYASQFKAITDGVKAYRSAVISIQEIIDGSGNISLSMNSEAFDKEMSGIEASITATREKITQAKLDYESQRLSDLGLDDADEIIQNLRDTGYTDEEILIVLQGTLTESDVEILGYLGQKPPDYEKIPSVDPKNVSDTMYYALYLQSEVLRRNGEIEEIETMCNAFTANGSVSPQFVNTYLEGIAACAANAVQTEIEAWALAASLGMDSVELDALYESIQAKQNLASFWCAIYALDSRKTALLGDISTFRISDLDLSIDYGKEGYEFTLVDTNVIYGWPVTFYDSDPVRVKSETFYQNFDTDRALLENALLKIEQRKQELFESTLDSICGSLTAIYPPLGLTYQILKLSYSLADGDYSADGFESVATAGLSLDQIKDQVEKLFPEACRKYGADIVSGAISSTVAIINFQTNIEKLDAEKQQEILEFWARQFGWSTTYTMNGHTYSSSLQPMNPQAKLGFLLIENGGIAELYNYYLPENSGTTSERLTKLKDDWTRDKPDTEMEKRAREYILHGGTLDDISAEDFPQFITALNNALSEACITMENNYNADAAQVIKGNMEGSN